MTQQKIALDEVLEAISATTGVTTLAISNMYQVCVSKGMSTKESIVYILDHFI